MSIDTKGLIVAGGIGAAALMLLSRKEDDEFGGMGGFWGGGGGSRETVTTTEEIPADTVTPTIVLPPIEPYQVNTSIPEWVFSTPAPVSGGGGDDTGGIVARTKKQTAVSPVYTEQHENVGPTNGFGGGGVGGRGAGEDEWILGLLGGIVSSAFSPINLFLSATPFGGVAGVLGVATKAAPVFEAVTKKEAAATTVIAPIAQAPSVSSPADAISSFYSAGADYVAPVNTTKKGSAVTTVYESGAYQTVSRGQIVSAGSAGSTAPPASAPSTGAAHAAATGQVYSSPGSSLGGSSGSVMSKKSASVLSGNSAAAKAWRARYGGG